MNLDREFIEQNLSKRALYEQLAEEAAELSQAALKMIRVIGNGNPTPMSYNEAIDNLIEEFSDIILVTKLLGIPYSQDIVDRKLKRWVSRIKEAERHEV